MLIQAFTSMCLRENIFENKSENNHCILFAFAFSLVIAITTVKRSERDRKRLQILQDPHHDMPPHVMRTEQERWLRMLRRSSVLIAVAAFNRRLNQEAQQSAEQMQGKWLKLLARARVLTLEDDNDFLLNESITQATPEEHKKKVLRRHLIRNALFIMWFLYLSFKQFWSRFTRLPDYVSGNTLSRTGNTAAIMQGLAAVGFTACASYRFAFAKSLLSGSVEALTATLRQLHHADGGHEERVKIASKVYLLAVTGIATIHLSLVGMICGLLAVNWITSQSLLERLCWLFYYIIDHALCFTMAVEGMLNPCMWMLVALSFNVDLKLLISHADRLNDLLMQSGTASIDEESVHELFHQLQLKYAFLVMQSQVINRFLAPILFVQSVFAHPIICCCLFISRFSDNIALYASLPGCGVSIAVATYALMAVAASVSAKSDQLHACMCSIAGNNARWPRLTLHQRRQLHEMIEELGSNDRQLLSLYTMDGQKYTSEMLADYVIETCLQYFLLMTFDQYFTLH